jgi:hypothetical protein
MSLDLDLFDEMLLVQNAVEDAMRPWAEGRAEVREMVLSFAGE